MWLRMAAVAALAIVPCVQAQAASPTLLTLDEAFARVALSHPDLRLFDARGGILEAERARALLRPALRAGIDVENVLGSGEARGFSAAEVTLTLAGVLERGGKLDARRVLAQIRIDALAVQREAQRLDLLADVARRHLAIVAARVQRDIAIADRDQRQRAVDAARRRLQAGASPASVVLTAEAALARSELAIDRADQQQVAARQHLAALWKSRDVDFDVAAVDPLRLPALAGVDALTASLDRTPELARFVDERRIGEARLRLARSAATPDIDWQVGVRRLQQGSDHALVGSLSLPLGGAARSRPDIGIAEAELAVLDIERESRELALHSTLVEAHGRYRVAQREIDRLRDDVLPRLVRAEQAAERAYRAGATSYLEWSQLQSETVATRRQQVDVAIDAQRAVIEIQRLTGQSFVVTSAIDGEGVTP